MIALHQKDLSILVRIEKKNLNITVTEIRKMFKRYKDSIFRVFFSAIMTSNYFSLYAPGQMSGKSITLPSDGNNVNSKVWTTCNMSSSVPNNSFKI